MKVLIVDDDLAIRRLISRILEKMDIETTTVSNAKLAIEIFQSSQFDRVITDINLGDGEDGIELAYTLKKLKPDTKILIVTGEYYNQEHENRAMKYHLEPIVSKDEINASLSSWFH